MLSSLYRWSRRLLTLSLSLLKNYSMLLNSCCVSTGATGFFSDTGLSSSCGSCSACSWEGATSEACDCVVDAIWLSVTDGGNGVLSAMRASCGVDFLACTASSIYLSNAFITRWPRQSLKAIGGLTSFNLSMLMSSRSAALVNLAFMNKSWTLSRVDDLTEGVGTSLTVMSRPAC